ncbi:hypothetical protein SEA_PUREGLOBE5_100 [Arthrobacter phage Pureglobe5]|nr:hypothetical protein SEA_PUREGLOBE5_100 [Arthrobacter phage Pureglobe5]
MIANENIRFYLDPLQSPFHTGTKMLVFRERYPRSFQSSVGQVVPVAKRVVSDHHLWWVHEDGRYVDGALESPKELQSYSPVLGMLDDEVFVVGQSYGVDGNGRMVIRDALRSDGKRLPAAAVGSSIFYSVDRWYQAASWALECMPHPGDTPDDVALRTKIARQRFELRLGEVCILREANDRDWREDLEDLDYGLPTPSYAVAVTGTVFLPLETRMQVDNLPESSRHALERVSNRGFSPGPLAESYVTRVEVPAQVVVRTGFEKYEQVEEVNEHTIRNAAVDHFSVANLIIGSVAKTPVLRSAY